MRAATILQGLGTKKNKHIFWGDGGDVSSNYAKVLEETNFQPRKFPEMGQKQNTEKILQGLGVAQAVVNERWPLKVKMPENQLLFVKKRFKFFLLLHISSM